MPGTILDDGHSWTYILLYFVTLDKSKIMQVSVVQDVLQITDFF